MNERQQVLSEISKLDGSERITYFLGDELFKNILRIVLPKCIELVGLTEDAISRTTFMEALDHKLTENSNTHKIFDFPWTTIINEICNISDNSPIAKAKFIYDVRWSYHYSYKDLVKDKNIGPLSERYHITMIDGLIHELRHIYQAESGKYYNSTEDFKSKYSNCKYDDSELEKDAIDYAYNVVECNIDLFRHICQQQIGLYQYKIDSGIIDLKSYT
jgi:hypothetical protein